MNVYYEHSRDEDGKILITDVTISSYDSGIGIAWRNQQEKVIADAMIKILKVPELQYRSFDEITKVWTYFGGHGKELIEALEGAFRKLPFVKFSEVEDLKGQIANGSIDPTKKKTIFNDPSKFFHNQGAIQAQPVLTKEKILERLSVFFGQPTMGLNKDELKKLYRKASLIYHPDRNAGDGSKMSEINMLWRELNVYL